MKRVIIILVILLMLSGCSSELDYSGDEIEGLCSNIPVVNQDHLIVSGDEISYSFASTNYADTLVLTKEGDEISQQRDITFTGRVPDSLILNLPKNFAETTDDIVITYRGSTEEVPWRVIEEDPVIELIDLKKAQVKETISVKSIVKILAGGDDFYELAYKEARLHQFYKLLQEAEKAEDQELFMLSLITTYPNFFVEKMGCDSFDRRENSIICNALINQDNKPCEELKSENEFACRELLYHSLINRYKDITPEQHLKMIIFSGAGDNCEKLSGETREECDKFFGLEKDEDEPEKIIYDSGSKKGVCLGLYNKDCSTLDAGEDRDRCYTKASLKNPECCGFIDDDGMEDVCYLRVGLVCEKVQDLEMRGPDCEFCACVADNFDVKDVMGGIGSWSGTFNNCVGVLNDYDKYNCRRFTGNEKASEFKGQDYWDFIGCPFGTMKKWKEKCLLMG